MVEKPGVASYQYGEVWMVNRPENDKAQNQNQTKGQINGQTKNGTEGSINKVQNQVQAEATQASAQTNQMTPKIARTTQIQTQGQIKIGYHQFGVEGGY